MPRRSRSLCSALGLAMLLFGGAAAAQEAETAKEFGKVSWERDFDRALKTARSRNLPLFVLFQEVPG